MERLTKFDYENYRALKPKQDVVDKLGELEDILESWHIENLEELKTRLHDCQVYHLKNNSNETLIQGLKNELTELKEKLAQYENIEKEIGCDIKIFWKVYRRLSGHGKSDIHLYSIFNNEIVEIMPTEIISGTYSNYPQDCSFKYSIWDKICESYQETFGNQQKYIDMLNKESSELLVNSLTEKDRQITELKKQLEEKEKDNQFLKKMYLSERTKNDNYHTEKYGLDKPVEELRKIKLTPKEKEIYYKGFDNCERQFATHIAELQQQLQSQPAEIMEKIRKWGQKHYNWVGDGTGYDGQDYNECIGFNKAIDQLNEVLDTILKEYQN